MTTTDWKARAEREAAAIVDEILTPYTSADRQWKLLVSAVAIGWLQGVDFGTHSTLADVAQAFEKARAEL